MSRPNCYRSQGPLIQTPLPCPKCQGPLYISHHPPYPFQLWAWCEVCDWQKDLRTEVLDALQLEHVFYPEAATARLAAVHKIAGDIFPEKGSHDPRTL